ncbi:MAG: TonB-dependent receptor [Candidatus Neomarinimicrobiota bacterium]|nr:TonB-dependent receptor [Candidatus Neomarinimicrobiota bacterium]
MLKLKILIYIAFILSISYSAEINGTLTDKITGQPLIGANIMVLGTSMGSSTDENGFYSISPIPIGKYKLNVSYIGYEDFSYEFIIGREQVINLDINLIPKAIEHNQTTVTANKRKDKITEAPASVEIIGSNQIRRQSTTNLGSFLKGMKGVDFTASGVDNYSISIRGFNSSTNARSLTLSDGRVASLPALKVMNYSTLPTSSEDVEKIEVVLGPSTALYGANAHSGVVNITTKPPSLSEGVRFNYSGGFDDRNLTKIDGRIAKKINNKLSFKISGTYLRANDWEYINENEWKAHRVPWTGHPYRTKDGKDNNPWKISSDNVDSLVNIYGQMVAIGDGEVNHGDLDGDGVAGEDWFNGYDDDGDGRIDEDYFTADNVDNFEYFIDLNNNNVQDAAEEYEDINSDGIWNEGEPFTDIGNGVWDENETCLSFKIENICVVTSENDFIDIGDGVWTAAEEFEDWNGDGVWNGPNGEIDENIDLYADQWSDGVDNNRNGIIDEDAEGIIELGRGSEWAYLLDEADIIIHQGRLNEYLIDDQKNPFYDSEKAILNEYNQLEYIVDREHVRGKYIYVEKTRSLIYDIFDNDYGIDGLPGDPFIDLEGDNQFTLGEPSRYDYVAQRMIFDDCGNDGFCWDENIGGESQQATYNFINNSFPVYDYNGNPYLIYGPDSDGSEGNGEWDPGDYWQDINQDNQISIENDHGWFVTSANYQDFALFTLWDSDGDGLFDAYKQTQQFNTDLDVWPRANGIWDVGEVIMDCGQDGFCWDFSSDGTPQPARDLFNNIVVDSNGDPIYILGPDDGEADGHLIARDELEMDGVYDIGDDCYGCSYEEINSIPEYEIVNDTDGDGLSDYPDFEVKNRKLDFRLDYDFSNDFNATFTSGYSWTKTQQVTQIGRYLTEGWESKYYQIRSRYKNFFAQVYYNNSYSGTTRSYLTGATIKDNSSDLSAQFQHSFDIREYTSLKTNIVWGFDYNKSMPKSFGTILNDGPNGYDNDGDQIFYQSDRIDNNNNGLIDERGEPLRLRNNGKDDNNNGLIDEIGEGVDEPDEFSEITSNEYGFYFQSKTDLTWDKKFEFIAAVRLDYSDQFSENGLQFGPKFGLFYNPNDKYSYRLTYGRAFSNPNVNSLNTDLYFGQNGIFSTYLRGNKNGVKYKTVRPEDNIVPPSFYNENGILEVMADYDFGNNYSDRVKNAPYFYNTNPSNGAPLDLIPLDTSHFIIFIPSLTDDGVYYNEEESINLVEIDPLKAEEIHSWEIGFKGMITPKTVLTVDAYASRYLDFFSPSTIITPLVKNKNTNITVGFMPTTDAGLNCPCGTAWDGKDNDGDWETYANLFGWRDDKNSDGNEVDPGEWGFIVSDLDTFFHPNEVGFDGTKINNDHGTDPATWTAVGVDEWHYVTGLNEAELAPHPSLTDSVGNPLMLPAIATAPPHQVLASLNYGTVWMQGADIAFTHIFSEKIILNGNFSWYNTSSFFNELTRKNEPINAPKFKYNLGIKWDSDFGDFALNYRHVDRFDWKDGIWEGVIGPYDIFDLHYNYEINKNLKLSLTAQNIFNDLHKEIIGGAELGRQLIFRLTSSF